MRLTTDSKVDILLSPYCSTVSGSMMGIARVGEKLLLLVDEFQIKAVRWIDSPEPDFLCAAAKRNIAVASVPRLRSLGINVRKVEACRTRLHASVVGGEVSTHPHHDQSPLTMLTEEFVAATLAVNKQSAHTSAALRDVGIFLHEFQPQSTLRHGFKKSSIQPQCMAISENHIFAAQADKAVINVYSRDKGNQEATVPFPDKIRSLAYAEGGAILVIGTEDGKLILWEFATGRLSTSASAHLQGVSALCITGNNDIILSGSADSLVHVWSLSKLVAFAEESMTYTDASPPNSPLRTFQNHRDAITALACGHSRFNTNFAVSGSDDNTCYVWHIDSCQVLKTVLLPSAPLCFALDPADRAIYVGGQEGHMVRIDLYSARTVEKANESSEAVALQLEAEDIWTPLPGTDGTVNCLTISYDGTALISGHSNGSLVRWDVAKRKAAAEIQNLNQPVTNIAMLRPRGLEHKRLGFSIPTVVKPRLELSGRTRVDATLVPASYSIQAQIGVTSGRANPQDDNDFFKSLSSATFPQPMLDRALQTLMVGSNGASGSTATNSNSNLAKVERLEEEVTRLKQQMAAMRDVEEKRKARHVSRMERREELGLKKRQAYFAAKKKGKDGDVAMKEFEEKEQALDVESDDEYLGDGMDVS